MLHLRSVIETARPDGPQPCRCLRWRFTEQLSSADGQPETFDASVPWSLTPDQRGHPESKQD
jgi:hypothetical protein